MALFLSNYIPRARGSAPDVLGFVKRFAKELPESTIVDPDDITYWELVNFLKEVDGIVSSPLEQGSCSMPEMGLRDVIDKTPRPVEREVVGLF